MRIKKENLDAAYKALMALQDLPDEAKGGGSSGGGKMTRRWFSWMPEFLTTLTTTKEVFEELGFEVAEDKDGNIDIARYDNKTGQEDIFVAAAAPFIEDTEYEWIGEDGEFWLWVFEGGTMYVRFGNREYGEREEVSVEREVGKREVMLASVDAMTASIAE